MSHNEERAASISSETFLPWSWRKQIPLNDWYPSTILHYITTQKTVFFKFTAMRTYNPFMEQMFSVMLHTVMRTLPASS